jgi:hypothetical protein
MLENPNNTNEVVIRFACEGCINDVIRGSLPLEDFQCFEVRGKDEREAGLLMAAVAEEHIRRFIDISDEDRFLGHPHSNYKSQAINSNKFFTISDTPDITGRFILRNNPDDIIGINIK